MNDLDQLSQLAQNYKLLWDRELSVIKPDIPRQMGQSVTPNKLLNPTMPQCLSMKWGYLLPISLLLTSWWCAFQRTPELGVWFRFFLVRRSLGVTACSCVAEAELLKCKATFSSCLLQPES